MNGLWLLPSKRRIPSLKRFFAAAKATGMSTPGRVVVNFDEWEEEKAHYLALADEMPDNWSFLTIEAGSVVEAMNGAWQAACQNLDWIGGLCDDHVPKTPNWDTKLIESVAGWNVVSSNDDWQAPKRIHGAIVWSGDLLRTLGGIYPPGFKHFFVDDIWEQLGNATNCWTVRMDVTVAHMHAFRQGKSDATTAHIGRFWDGDEKRFRGWMAEEKRVACDAIMDLAERHGGNVIRPRLDGMSIYIATPTGDGTYDRHFMRSFENTTNMIRQCGGRVDFGELPYCADISLARAKLLGAFLRSPHTHMMAIDADMGWSAIDVIRLAMLKRDFVAAAGPKKQYPINFAFNLERSHVVIVEGETELWLVSEIGMAFAMISRSCAERMAAGYPDLVFMSETGQTEHDVFAPMIVNQRRKAEDFAFCHRWKALGGEIFMLPSVKLKHTGGHTFEASVDEAVGRAEIAAE
jgi:hypothetical protein